jgi:hypothetical protein
MVSVPVAISLALFTFTFAFALTLTLTLPISIHISLLMSIRLTFSSTLSTTFLLLHSSRHSRVVIHRIQNSLHQPLIRIGIIILRMSRRGPMGLLSTTTTLRLAHGTAG